MQGVIYRDGSIVGDTQSDVLYFDDPQEYYDIPLEVRQSLGKLVILDTDGDNISADNIYYDDELSVKDKIEEVEDRTKSIVTVRSVRCYGNNAQYVSKDTTVPVVPGYRAIYAVPGAAGGIQGAYTYVYECRMLTTTIVRVIWDMAVPTDCFLEVYVLYVREDLL
ncbi:MAG: hypothetical protein KBT27_16280 [Prevotellaceae bacterium]|nr:hypothetical protein [Candidatus Faecinaster equi]